MPTGPPTRSDPAKLHSEAKLEARLRLRLEDALRRLGYRGFRTGQRAEAGPELLDGEGRARFDALRHHRFVLARREGVPPYVIASDRTLREIALLRPRNVQELEFAHGIGPAKQEKYGAGLLAVVSGEGAK